MRNKVRQHREFKGMSGEELARLTRIGPSNLSKIERGHLFPYPGWRKRIAAALGESEANLFPGVETENRAHA